MTDNMVDVGGGRSPGATTRARVVRTASTSAAVELLRQRGQDLFDEPRKPGPYTSLTAANALVCDVEHHPHAFVLASVCDRQDSAERVWAIPYWLGQRVGSVEFADLSALSPQEILTAMTAPDALHRFPQKMAGFVHAALQRIGTHYDGDASRIWTGTPSSGELLLAFLGFRGVGVKIASMASNILVRDFRVPVADKRCLDVSPDVHVCRVFTRIGLIEQDIADAQTAAMYAARDVSPEYPGVLDLGSWEIGRKWCRPAKPQCDECRLGPVCPRVGSAPHPSRVR